MISKTCAVSIPHTRRHLKFINDVATALEKSHIEHEMVVDEGDSFSQESWVRVYCSSQDESKIQYLVQYVSDNP